MPEFNFKPDRVVHVNADDGTRILVALSKGGEDFPWAPHNGRVIIGPVSGSLSDGTPSSKLQWNTDRYWVIEALDAQGNVVELTPEQYAKAVRGGGRQ